MYAEPKTWYSRDWTVHCEDGRDLLLDLANWREGAELELDGESFTLAKESAFSRRFSLRRGDRLVARAEMPSRWRSRFEIEIGRDRYVLEKASVFRRGFLVRREDEVVGSIEPRGMLTRKSDIDLPDDWPLAVRLFVFWLVVVIWNRQAAAAAAGGS